MSEIKVDTIGPRVDNGTLTIGASGDTVNIAGTAGTGFPTPTTGIAASAISSGTIATARLGSGTASSSTFLRGDQTYAAAGGDMTPSFQAYGNTSYQAVADGTYTTVQMPNELYDTSSAYSTSTYKFTPQTSGKYFLWGQATGDGNWDTTMFLLIQKNQSTTAGNFWQSVGYVTANGGLTCSGVLTANGSSDYFELRVYQGGGGNRNLRNQPSEIQFGGYKIIE